MKMDGINQINKIYIGTKLINSRPAVRKGGKIYTIGEPMPQSMEPVEDGYEVVYEDGYVSWSPKAVFEDAYKPADKLGFGEALFLLKRGHKLARTGWNGKGMWIVLMPELKLQPYSSQAPGAKVNDRTAKHIGEDTPFDSRPYISMWTAQRQWQPGWLASQADMLAEDWFIVE